MQQCGNCGHTNRSGVVFCENCGASLIGKIPLSTKALESASGAKPGEIEGDTLSSQDITKGMATFVPGDNLKLDIEGAAEPLVLEPKAETILGRRDPATGATPDIDLTPFAGYRMGVSRRHAAIRHGDDNTLNIWDLGSSNGTFLNGQRLNAHRPYRLHDGDELRLGQMVMRLYFKPTPAPAQTKAAPPAPAREMTPKPAASEKPKPQPSPPRPALTPPLTVTAPQILSQKAAQKPPATSAPPQPPKPAEEAPAVPATPAASQPSKAAETLPVPPAALRPEAEAAPATPAAPKAETAPAASEAGAVSEAETAPSPPEETPPAEVPPPPPAPQPPAAEAAPVPSAGKAAEPPPAPKTPPPAAGATVPTAKNGKPVGDVPSPSEQQADRSKPGEDDASS
ncbi:MAG: FHA domain-containing protein [Anaerolineae bacterium]|nr:FHA domain-containing protein [Anaerolineae bacterium]